MNDELVVESPAIGWSRAEVWRRLGVRGFYASSAAAALLFGAGIVTDVDAIGIGSFFALVAAAGSAAVAGVAGWTGPSWRRGTLTVSAREVVVRTDVETMRVALADVSDGWVEDPHGVRLRLKSGFVLSVATPDVETAEAVLRATGVSVAQRVLRVELTSAASRTPLGVPLAATVTSGLVLAVVFMFGVLGFGVIDLVKHGEGVAAVTVAVMLLMIATLASLLGATVSTLRGKRLTIGVDGLSIQGVAGKRFIAYRDIASVAPDPRGVRVRTKRGNDLLLATWKRGEAKLALGEPVVTEGGRKQKVVHERILRAAALHQPGGPELAVLDRAGRPLAAWRDDVRALARQPADYRRVQLNAHDLAEIVTDASAPAERRIAAVLALGGRDGAEPAAQARDRVRIAIDTCADDELKAALEQAAADELDDETLRKAVRRRDRDG